MEHPAAPICYRFGTFEFSPEQRSLSAGGKRLALSSRAFDILNLLVEQRHRIVTKDEIISVVWRGMTVDDNNLAVQISALRRTLADHAQGQFIATVPGRGYRFVGPIDAPEAAVQEAAGPQAVSAAVDGPGRAHRSRVGLAGLAGALVAACVALAMVLGRVPPEAPRLSIAVLPFRDLSDGGRQGYLADAITDDLTTDLSHIPASRVIARESSDAYRNRAVPTASIGQALGVRYLLEGSLRQEPAGLHINVQLIEAASGTHIWANTFDVGHDAIPTARTDIVRRLANVLDYTLVQVESARSLHDRPDNPDALDFYLRARSILDRSSDFAGLRAAQALLERAVSLEPESADSSAVLGSVLLRKISVFDDSDEWMDHARAEELIRKAMRTSPQNVAAITAAGQLAEVDGHCDRAQEDFRLVLSLQPDDLTSHKGLAFCANRQGEMHQLIDETEAILRTDPTGPGAAVRREQMGMAYLMLGEPKAALEWLNRANALMPPGSIPDTDLDWREWCQIYSIAALQLSGDNMGAAREYHKYADSHPNRTVWHLASYDSHAQSLLPGNKAYRQALHGAGMPMFGGENGGFVTKQIKISDFYSDFDIPPAVAGGAENVNTTVVHAMLSAQPPPLLLDVGNGAGVLPGSVLPWPQGVWGDRDQMLLDAATKGVSAHRAIIVLGDGPLGFAAYNAVHYLVAHGVSRVLWFKGGEEAWAEAGLPAEDKRAP